ncbi:MAG: glycosyltransferase family 4 protein [Thermoplasmata archaeon]|nr:glycosyltransferase family 4 protein [Thermoplasmata archaeon]
MRIVQVSPFFYPHAGGVESHVRSVAGELARMGHDVTVVTSRHTPSLPEEERFEGFRVLRARTWGVVYNTPIAPATGRLLASVPADVIHLHFPPPLTSYFAVRGLAGRSTPTCLTYHCDLYLEGPIGALLTGLYSALFLPPTLDRVNQVIAHTRSYAATSRAIRGRRLGIIPSTVDTRRFRPDLDGTEIRERLGLQNQRVLAFTGRLVAHKGVDVILRALRDLPPDVSLLAVGHGPRLSELQSLARRFGVERRVRFCTEVSDEELPLYLRAADLFVFPSQNRLEGFGLVVAEAMASGLPVIIADMPGVREVIEPGREGLLVEPLIAHDLSEKILQLLDDPVRRAAMGAAARTRAVQRFSLEIVARQLLRLYEALRAAG